MKTFLTSVGLFFGVVCMGVILSVFIFPAEAETPGWFIAATGLLAAAAAVAFAITERSAGMSSRAADRPLFSGTFYHISGLNLPPETKCKVSYWPDHLSFSAMNQTFSLAHSKVRAVARTTKKDIQKQYVSRAGGAVAGAALFGPLGALIGGGAQQKTIRNYRHFLIFAYGDPGEDTKYIIMSLTDWGSDGRRFAAAYKRQLKGSDTRIVL